MCCSKLILFISNGLLFAFGIFVVASASIVISKGSDYGTLLMDGTFTLPIIILLLGIFACILGFLGCFGALKESKCMLYTYSGIVLALFCAEITVAILIIAHPSWTRNALNESLSSQYNVYGEDGQSATTNSIDNMQRNLKCCGVESPLYWKIHNMQEVPDSCCAHTINPFTTKKPHYRTAQRPFPLQKIGQVVKRIGICNIATAYQQGCVDAIVAEFQSMTLLLGVLGVVLAIFMIFSMSTACGLAKKHN